MGGPEITAFLTHLAVEEHVSASTQNQALAALLFLYRRVLNVDPGDLEGVVRFYIYSFLILKRVETWLLLILRRN